MRLASLVFANCFPSVVSDWRQFDCQRASIWLSSAAKARLLVPMTRRRPLISPLRPPSKPSEMSANCTCR